MTTFRRETPVRRHFSSHRERPKPPLALAAASGHIDRASAVHHKRLLVEVWGSRSETLGVVGDGGHALVPAAGQRVQDPNPSL